MNRRKVSLQILIGLLLIALAMWVVTTHVEHWGDWIVFGVIVLTTFGAAWGIYTPRYTTKKRTVVRSSKPPDRRYRRPT
jgi:thiol:disulfide interchange protein